MTSRNQRGFKTTRSQFEAYLNELMVNKPFREDKFDGSDPDVLKRTWNQLSDKLNALGGPCRDVNGWKRIFCDWKSQTRGKARKLRLANFQTGNVGAPPKPLSDVEEQLLDLTGRVVVTGMENIPEIGIDGPIIPNTSITGGIENESIVGNQDVEMKNTDDGEVNTPSTSRMNKKKARSPKKKTSLLGCLQDMANKTNMNDKSVEVLGVIAKELQLRRKIEQRKLHLDLLKLKLKYPDHDFTFEESDSE